MVRIACYAGNALRPYLPALARLRIAVFRAYPYLYEGDLAYEEAYLHTYADTPESVVVLAFDGEEIVGASSGLPLAVAMPEVIAPFIAQGYDPRAVFYYGESVLLPQYRGQGIGVRFFAEREAHARRAGRFAWATFCAVERPIDHPRRPADYTPLDAFWQRRGFTQQPALRATFSWQDVDDPVESPKPMVFWLKALV